MGKFVVEHFASPEELAKAAAEQWLDQLASLQSKSYHAAFSGGRISRQFFAETAESAMGRNVSFTAVHFFWADERCVPPDDLESNYRIARERLFAPAAILPEQVHRSRGEAPPKEAARSASAEIRRIVPVNAEGWPVLDMIFLGMGEDGHVASLFPPVDAAPANDVYLHVVASKPPPNRITLCYEMIVAAKEVWVLASGAGKEAALRDSLLGKGKTPLGYVISRREATRVLTNISNLSNP